MHIEYRKEYSHCLNRDMEYKKFGHAGKMMLVFPCQDGRFYDWENYGMVNVLAPELEQGRLQLICVDSMDKETLTNFGGDCRWRSERYEAYYHYIVDELIPTVKAENPQFDTLAISGCSTGAFHAGNFFFRNPFVFDTAICLSGLYDAGYFYGGYVDDLIYMNSPLHNLPNLPDDHPHMEQLRNNCKMVFCVGQGAWEDELLDSTRKLHDVMRAKNIPGWVDYWGHDVHHDWDWWRVQLRYFAYKMLV